MDADLARLAPPADPNAVAFAELLRQRDEDLPLDRASVLLARSITYPGLDVMATVARLDRLAAELADRLPSSGDPERSVAALQAFLGGTLGFRGPAEERGEDYYDPRNSFLNDVLARRVGIPITLSIVYLEVGRRAGLPLAGVSMPFHFVIKYALGDRPHEAIFLDPFAGGAVVTAAELRERFERGVQGQAQFADHYLGAVTKKQMLTRLLQNLRGIYLSQHDLRRLRGVLDYLLLLIPWDLELRRDRGLLALRLGESAQALDDLQTYARFVEHDPYLPIIRGYIEALRRRFSLGG